MERIGTIIYMAPLTIPLPFTISSTLATLENDSMDILNFSEVNYTYDEELVIPIIENTPQEEDLKVGLQQRILAIFWTYNAFHINKNYFSEHNAFHM